MCLSIKPRLNIRKSSVQTFLFPINSVQQKKNIKNTWVYLTWNFFENAFHWISGVFFYFLGSIRTFRGRRSENNHRSRTYLDIVLSTDLIRHSKIQILNFKMCFDQFIDNLEKWFDRLKIRYQNWGDENPKLKRVSSFCMKFLIFMFVITTTVCIGLYIENRLEKYQYIGWNELKKYVHR